MKPLAMNLRLVVNAQKRLACEAEILFDDGTSVLRQITINETMTIFFEDLEREAREKIEDDGA